MNFAYKNSQRGMTLVELLIAMAILAVGMAGVLVMITSAISTNSRNRNDSTGTMLAQMVTEQITAQASTLSNNPQITDCGGTVWTISTAGASPGPGAAGASLITSGGNMGQLDWNAQTYAAVAANYKMRYQACAPTANQRPVYEVRWNVATNANDPTKLVTVSARQIGFANQTALSGLMFARPVTLRTIVGP